MRKHVNIATDYRRTKNINKRTEPRIQTVILCQQHPSEIQPNLTK